MNILINRISLLAVIFQWRRWLLSAVVLSLLGCQAPTPESQTRIPIPAVLLAACLPQLPPEPMSYGDSLSYNEHLLTVIATCNHDKQLIQQIEAQR